MESTLSSEVLRMVGQSSPSCAESSFRELDDAFLQTQTRIWLGEVLQLRLDDQISISEVLADGELLFEVSKVVWSLLLERHTDLRHEKDYENEPFASKKTSGRYMPYSNVDSFLKICKILGLTGIDLFSPSDVVEKRNTRRVCMCIRSFSKKARSQDLNVPDFDVVTYTVAMPTDMVGSLRRSLELSQNCLRGDSTLHDGVKKKFWQRSGAEVSDDSEFGNMALQDEGLVSDCVNDTLSCVNSSSEGSILSPILTNDGGKSFRLQSDAKRKDKNGYPESIFEMYSENQEKDNEVSGSSSSSIYSSTVSKPGTSNVEAVDHFGEENGSPGFSYTDPDLEYSSILKNEMNDSTPISGFISPKMMISCSTGSNHFLSDGENSLCYLPESVSSCGSNSNTRTINIAKGLNSVGDNMEVRFASALSAESGDVLRPNEYFEVHDGIQDIHFLESNNVCDSLNGTDMIKCRTLACRFHDERHDNVGHVHDNVGHGDGEVQFSCITSFHCPDHKLFESGCQGDVCYYRSGFSLSQVKSFAARKDMTYRIDAYAIEDVGCVDSKKMLSCQCQSPSDFCKLGDKGKHSVGLVRNGADGHNGCNLTFIMGGPYDNRSNISSSDAMSSTVLEHGIATIDIDDSKRPKNYDLFGHVENGIECDHSHASSYVKGTEHISKICAVHADDFSVFEQDIGRCKEIVPDTIAEVAAISFKQLKRTASMESCLTDESSESISQSSHPSCAHLESTLCHAEHEIKEGTSLKDVASSKEDSAEKVNTSTKAPQEKSHKKLLLKSVLGGTAAFGLMFLLLRGRPSNERSTGKEKTGESSVRCNDKDKVKGARLSSQKAQEKTGKANGVYPAEKLKFGF